MAPYRLATLLLVLVVSLTSLAACSRNETPTPTVTVQIGTSATPPATATETPTPTKSATPSPSATFTPELPTLVVTDTPKPGNIVTVAALAMTATFEVRTKGTPTPLMVRFVRATPPFVVTPTATPENEATATYVVQLATAQAFLFGTPTPLPAFAITVTPEVTPTATGAPADDMAAMVGMAVETMAALPTRTPTATPSETPIPLLIYLDQLTPSPSPTATITPTPTPSSLPAELRGKILFLTDRFKKKATDAPMILVMDADGSNAAILTDEWVYERALELNRTSVHGQVVFVQESDEKGDEGALWVINPDGWKSFLFDMGYVANGDLSVEYDPAWSPDSADIAFVSNAPGNDEIYVFNKDTQEVKRLTYNLYSWDKHPSYSPDGKKIVFWSNRDIGRKQIWVMGADGSDPVNISNNEYEDYDPVWVR